MGWTRSLVLSLGAWVLVAGSGCPSSFDEDEPILDCAEIYVGPVEGFQICSTADPSSCLFYRVDTENAAISCGAICAFGGAACLAAYNPGEIDVCELGNQIPCEEAVNAAVCKCGAATMDVDNRIHIVNGSNVPGITVTVSVVGGQSYDAGELATADMCCTGPNFLIEAGIGAFITIEAQWMDLTASNTCQVTQEADSPVGTNLQTFVNVYAEGAPAAIIIACDLGLVDANGGTGGSGGAGGSGGSAQ